MQSSPDHPKVLGSWKEIASYLGKGVRTVQRWELQFGLPVRRPNDSAKGVVCALPEELDEWFAKRWGQRGSMATVSPADGPPAQPRNGALNYGPLKAKIEVARGLLTANQLLITEVMRSIQGLRQQCQVFKMPGE